MKIHEYQAKQLFKQYGIATTCDIVVSSAEDAVCVAETMRLPVVLKAQVHTGGRGKAGGVRVVHCLEDVAQAANDILSLTINGLPVKKLAVTPALTFTSESYLGLLVDRAISRVAFIGCAEGGMEIEETAKTCPGNILRLEMGATELSQLTVEQCLPFARELVGEDHGWAAAQLMLRLAKMFIARDCSLIEINPLVRDETGKLIALDGKVVFDDNALYRQQDNADMRDLDSEDPDEIAAKNGNVTFVRLDGSVGCMVNGAGLAMATMDTIKFYGGSPANFLDAGGSSDPNKVLSGLKLILKDPNVKSIFVNIFGGITRCDDIARGILSAMEQYKPSVPIVIRLAGTNEKEGKALIAGTDLIITDTLEQGAQSAIRMGEAR